MYTGRHGRKHCLSGTLSVCLPFSLIGIARRQNCISIWSLDTCAASFCVSLSSLLSDSQPLYSRMQAHVAMTIRVSTESEFEDLFSHLVISVQIWRRLPLLLRLLTTTLGRFEDSAVSYFEHTIYCTLNAIQPTPDARGAQIGFQC